MAKTKKEKKSKKRKHEKKKLKKLKKFEKQNKIEPGDHTQTRKKASQETTDVNYAIPLDLMCNKSHAPETSQEYLKRQNQIRHETDPITGRQRLVRGDGEILEEIVSRERHLQINKQATQGDGLFFQKNTTGTKRK